MKISTAALSFLILAAALGSPTHGSQVYEPRAPEPRLEIHQLKSSIRQESGPHHPPDCCFSYAQKIRCIFMENFFETSSECSKPGVIFITKRRRHVCAHPSDRKVQECIMKLTEAKDLTKIFA
ncbi:C-C motif chemokine 15-like isoform X1 [Pteropus medius]|uniref:C-C motif chemokine n=1 Tax=Pteropus vampyrus TaxID=132908 RepID=A0A6P3R9I5_PTEVA|nr:C-C motif chemokine 15-like isoform X1 [Pteropus vampyrus]XP_039741861.1 C-C motif chemokine 15-like isoform X1 [Pteropus giganteus]